jgi:hypothetical protein
MSEYATTEPAAEPAGEPEGAAAESEPWNFAENVSREEWEQVTGNLNYLGSVAASVQEQQQAEQTEAALIEWLGDEFEDPDGYEERRQELSKLSIDQQMAPYVAYFQEQQHARMLAEAEGGLDRLLAAEAQAAGVELPAEARQVVFDASSAGCGMACRWRRRQPGQGRRRWSSWRSGCTCRGSSRSGPATSSTSSKGSSRPAVRGRRGRRRPARRSGRSSTECSDEFPIPACHAAGRAPVWVHVPDRGGAVREDAAPVVERGRTVYLQELRCEDRCPLRLRSAVRVRGAGRAAADLAGACAGSLERT